VGRSESDAIWSLDFFARYPSLDFFCVLPMKKGEVIKEQNFPREDFFESPRTPGQRTITAGSPPRRN